MAIELKHATASRVIINNIRWERRELANETKNKGEVISS
jgi:hypothetical protein